MARPHSARASTTGSASRGAAAGLALGTAIAAAAGSGCYSHGHAASPSSAVPRPSHLDPTHGTLVAPARASPATTARADPTTAAVSLQMRTTAQPVTSHPLLSDAGGTRQVFVHPHTLEVHPTPRPAGDGR